MNNSVDAKNIENGCASASSHNKGAAKGFSFAGLIKKIEAFLDWQLIGIFFIWVFLLFTMFAK